MSKLNYNKNYCLFTISLKIILNLNEYFKKIQFAWFNFIFTNNILLIIEFNYDSTKSYVKSVRVRNKNLDYNEKSLYCKYLLINNMNNHNNIGI